MNGLQNVQLIMELDTIRQMLAPLCREFNVRRLDAFGSVARGTATQLSDVDLIVEFREPPTRPAKSFFGLLHRIEDALGCKVDLLTLQGIRNPYFKRRILQEKVSLYEG